MKRMLIIPLCIIYTFFMADLFNFYYAKDETEKSIVTLGGVVCGLLPLLYPLFTKLRFNPWLIIFYFMFLFASQYLGSVSGWYEIEWWDTFLHGISGILLAFVGIALYKYEESDDSEISSWFAVLFVFSFTVLGGTIWEVYEFTFDQFFQTTFQDGGIRDTMTDLIADTVGGFVIAIWAGVRKKVKSKHS